MAKSPSTTAPSSPAAASAKPVAAAPPANGLVDTILTAKILHEGVLYRPGVVYRMDAATRAAADIAPLIKKS